MVIVLGNSTHLSIARVIGSFVEPYGVRIHLFINYEEALEWIHHQLSQ